MDCSLPGCSVHGQVVFFGFFFNGENRIKVCSSVDGSTSVSSFAIMLELSEMSPLEGAG